MRDIVPSAKDDLKALVEQMSDAQAAKYLEELKKRNGQSQS